MIACDPFQPLPGLMLEMPSVRVASLQLSPFSMSLLSSNVSSYSSTRISVLHCHSALNLLISNTENNDDSNIKTHF